MLRVFSTFPPLLAWPPPTNPTALFGMSCVQVLKYALYYFQQRRRRRDPQNLHRRGGGGPRVVSETRLPMWLREKNRWEKESFSGKIFKWKVGSINYINGTVNVCQSRSFILKNVVVVVGQA